MSLPQGASLAFGEYERIQKAVEELAKDPNDEKRDHHAPRQLEVKVNLRFHHEYPKHVTVQRDGQDVVVIVNSREEEAAAKAGE